MGWKKRKYGNPLGRWVYEPYKSEGWDIPEESVQIDIVQRQQGKNKGLYSVQIWHAMDGKVIEKKFFKTKIKAVNAAEQYMKKHPSG